MSNTLIFEAVGMKEGNAPSCRIRTRVKSPQGKNVYLELNGIKQHKYIVDAMKNTGFEWVGWVEHAFYIKEDGDESGSLRNKPCGYYEYSYDGILKFVNSLLGTSFEKVLISNNVRVHDTKECLC